MIALKHFPTGKWCKCFGTNLECKFNVLRPLQMWPVVNIATNMISWTGTSEPQPPIIGFMNKITLLVQLLVIPLTAWICVIRQTHVLGFIGIPIGNKQQQQEEEEEQMKEFATSCIHGQGRGTLGLQRMGGRINHGTSTIDYTIFFITQGPGGNDQTDIYVKSDYDRGYRSKEDVQPDTICPSGFFGYDQKAFSR